MTSHKRGYILGLCVGMLLGIALTMAVVRFREAVRCPEPVRGVERATGALEAQEWPADAVFIKL